MLHVGMPRGLHNYVYYYIIHYYALSSQLLAMNKTELKVHNVAYNSHRNEITGDLECTYKYVSHYQELL